jgi:hypothetical protein
MNRYRVGYKLPDGKMHFDEVAAGDLRVEAGCLIFTNYLSSAEVVMAYKSWDLVVRTEKAGKK